MEYLRDTLCGNEENDFYQSYFYASLGIMSLYFAHMSATKFMKYVKEYNERSGSEPVMIYPIPQS